MNNFEIIILALALAFNSWNAYVNAGLLLAKSPLSRRIYYSGITFLMQFVMAGTGIWAGNKTCSFEMRTNMMISLSLMLLVGLKMLLEGIRSQTQETPSTFTENKSTFFAALYEGIIPFIIGISIGLLSEHPYLHLLLIGLFLISGIIAGLVVAFRMGVNALKLKFNFIGGFLFIAAAIKLALTITRF